MEANTKNPEEQKPEDPRITEFKKQFVDKVIKITLTDKRVLYGKLSCIDKQKNIVLADSIEQIAHEYIAPVNEQLSFLARSSLKASNYVEVEKDQLENQELMEKVDKEFAKNKFYVGQVIVQGKSIEKIEVQKSS